MTALSNAANAILSNAQKKWLKISRAKAFEAIGSQRYSNPSIIDLKRRVFPHLPERGVFIECGANDGFSQSNTYYLERIKGWTGVLVEPIPTLFQIARGLRRKSHVANCALGPTDGGLARIIYSDLMSTTVGSRGSEEQDRRFAEKNASYVRKEGNYEIEVPIRSLSSVLKDAKVSNIDFFSLDVEGFEAQVIEGWDRRRHRIETILVETDDVDKIGDLLSPTHYLLERITHHDYLFKAR